MNATTTHPRIRYSDDVLAKAVAESTTMYEVLDRLGIPRTGGSHAHLSRRVRALGIETSHFRSSRGEPPPLPVIDRPALAAAFANARSLADLARRFDLPVTARTRRHLTRQLIEHGLDPGQLPHRRVNLEEHELRRAAAECTSLIGVVRALEMDECNGNIRRVRRALDAYGIDTAHFKRRSWRTVDSRPSRLTTPSKILRVLPSGAARTGGDQLRRALLALGVPLRCDGCGLAGEWQGKRLTLEVDHVNGNRNDNRTENLRFLCPNCHATTDSYCRKMSARTA